MTIADPCRLHCRLGNQLAVFGIVPDGTRATKSGPDVCINGNPEVRWMQKELTGK